MDIEEQSVRYRTIALALAEAQLVAKDIQDNVFIVCCIGEPYCFLIGDEASSAIQSGCPICETYCVEPSGEYNLYESPKGLS